MSLMLIYRSVHDISVLIVPASREGSGKSTSIRATEALVNLHKLAYTFLTGHWKTCPDVTERLLTGT